MFSGQPLKSAKSPLAESANFHVDSNALQHGFSLFQQILNKRGTLLIPVGGELEPVNDFFDLKAAGRTLKIKFLRYNYPPSEETPPELLERILRIRNDLLRKSNYPESLTPRHRLCSAICSYR